jgi:hypothetical protein
MLFAIVPLGRPGGAHMLTWGQEGIPDSLCNITDTVCVEPQPKQSNFTDTYTHKIVRPCPIAPLQH